MLSEKVILADDQKCFISNVMHLRSFDKFGKKKV